MKTTRGVENDDVEDKATKMMMMKRGSISRNNDCEYGDNGISRSNDDYDDDVSKTKDVDDGNSRSKDNDDGNSISKLSRTHQAQMMGLRVTGYELGARSDEARCWGQGRQCGSEINTL